MKYLITRDINNLVVEVYLDINHDNGDYDDDDENYERTQYLIS
jgi:hypothetical protein